MDRLQQLQNRHASILLVEDDYLTQRVTTLILENLGCQVTLACNAKQALEKMVDSYDVILLDIGLPDIDGITLAKQYHEQKPASERAKIIAITAHVTQKHQNECSEAGIDGFLKKPVLRDDLLTLLADVLLKAKTV